MSQQIHVTVKNLLAEFPDLLRLARGSSEATLGQLSAPENASPDSLIFVSTAEHFRTALKSAAKVWVVAPNLEALITSAEITLLVSPNVQLAMARIAKTFFAQTRNQQIVGDAAIHPRAVIAPSARVGAGTKVGPGAVIGEDCVVGENCVIGANAILEPEVKIGPRTHIHSLVFIGHGCEVGADCEIQPNSTIGSEGYGYAQDKQFNHYRIVHYGRVVLEDRVDIGANVQIDRGTFLDSRIGSGTKIDNHCHFGHNIQIGKNTLITGGMITAGSVSIGSYCVFGGRTTIAGHLSICDRVHIGGISGIAKSITKPGKYGGLPLQELGLEMRTRASLKSLPGLLKQVRRISKHLGLEPESETGSEP